MTFRQATAKHGEDGMRESSAAALQGAVAALQGEGAN